MKYDRELRLNKIVNDYDSSLYVQRLSSGMMQVLRKAADKSKALYISDPDSDRASLSQYIISLTDNWRPDGMPVDVGIENLLTQLKSMDSWRDDTAVKSIPKDREAKEDMKSKHLKTEITAASKEVYSAFRKAVS